MCAGRTTYLQGLSFARQLETELAAAQEQIERLRRALEDIVGVIDAHDTLSENCNGTEDKYCDCLCKSVKKAKAALSAAPSGERFVSASKIEAFIKSLPGGNSVDPQSVADGLREMLGTKEAE